MAWLTNVVFRNQVIENERLVLTDKGSLYFLSTNLTLRHCTVVLKVSARNLVIKQARFIDCTFEVKQELKNHQDWVFASLKGCRFKGRFSGCDFGNWPGYSALRFPKWPCFTFLDPIRHAPELCGIKWPGLCGDILVGNLHEQPPTTVALTEHAPTVAKQLGTTPEALRAVIEQFDCIVY
jgi:hypothetical protein